MVMCFDFYSEVGGWLLSECLSYLFDKQRRDYQQVVPLINKHVIKIANKQTILSYIRKQ